jgi:hypothetical protein
MSEIQEAARAVAARHLRQRARELADIHDRPLAMSSPLTPGQHAAIADYLLDAVDTSDVLRLMEQEIALLEHRLADAQARLAARADVPPQGVGAHGPRLSRGPWGMVGAVLGIATGLLATGALIWLRG